MPSFKSCVASMAVILLTFAPITTATVTVADSIMARRVAEHLHVARAVSPDSSTSPLRKRTSKAKAKAKAVPKVTKSKAKTKAVTPSSSGTSFNPYAKGSTFLSTLAAVQAGQRRCGVDASCAKTNPPVNATPYCVQGLCTFRCNTGFAPSGSLCAPEPSQCNGVTCPDVDGGFKACNPLTGACSQQCFPNQGYALFMSGTQQNPNYKCFQTTTDANNCGAVGTTCPPSYNGMGTPKCHSSKCSLACPVGTFPRPAMSTTNPMFCA